MLGGGEGLGEWQEELVKAGEELGQEADNGVLAWPILTVCSLCLFVCSPGPAWSFQGGLRCFIRDNTSVRHRANLQNQSSLVDTSDQLLPALLVAL